MEISENEYIMNSYLKNVINNHIKSSDIFIFTLLPLFVLLTRIPFINSDYGIDPDAFRVVSVAKHIAKTGEYIYSRPPGNPLYEYIISFVASYDPWVTNFLSAIASSIAVVFFALILRHIKIKHYYILSIFFSLVPIIYINSINTMDYMIALAFTLASIFFIFIRKPILAGILIGLAVGCRLTYIAMILPLALWILFEKNNILDIKKTLYFVITAIMISILTFIPVFLTYGLGFFTFADNIVYPSFYKLILTGVVHVWEVLYLISFFILFFIMIMKRKILKVYSRKAFLFSISIVFIYTIIFLRLPHESAYMIPVVPFLIITIALVVPDQYIKNFSIFVIILAFVQLLSGYSPISKYCNRRTSNYLEAKNIVHTVSKLKGKVIIVAGWNRPRINLFQLSNKNKVKYEYLIENKEKYYDYIKNGYKIYYLQGMNEYNKQHHNLNLSALGAKRLEIH